jgi:hypothetical protein
MRSAPITSIASISAWVLKFPEVLRWKLAQKKSHPLLCRIIMLLRDTGIGVIDAPDGIRQVLAHMAEDDLQSRVRIEQA